MNLILKTGIINFFGGILNLEMLILNFEYYFCDVMKF
jgi:hypothetical protein